jgi:hypothetical protein
MDAFGQVIKSEQAIGDTGRRGAVIKNGHRHGIQSMKGQSERSQRIAQGDWVEISQVNADDRLWQPASFILADQLHAQSSHGVKIIVKCFGSFGGGIYFQPGFQVCFHCPGGRSAAHGHAGEQNGFFSFCGFSQAAIHDHRRRGQD